MSKLRETLEAGDFAVAVELKPPRGTEVGGMLAPVTALRERVTAFGLPDNAQACLHLSSLAAARLVKEAGGEPLLHLSCRDRNRLALESDLLGAAALGVENLLLVSGDYVTLGDHPQAKPVYDADSVQLLQIAQGLRAGQDSTGQPLSGNPAFYLGAVVIPEADPLAPQLLKMEKKIAAGAQFLVTAPVFHLERLRSFREHLTDPAIKLLVTVKVLEADELSQAMAGGWRKVYSLPQELLQELAGQEPAALESEAVRVAGRLVRQIKEERLGDGVYLQARGREDLLAAILKQAEL
jgi:methylenetetrahydrofolate reductase (NADPH)